MDYITEKVAKKYAYAIVYILHKEYGGVDGHCYIASEAYYHLRGGKGAGLKPLHMKWECEPHWLINDNGRLVDLTREQFSCTPNYALAKGKGFLTKAPSRRTRELIEKVLCQFSNTTTK